MNAVKIYETAAQLVLAAWNEEADGEQKLQDVVNRLQEFVEANDVAVLSVLPI